VVVFLTLIRTWSGPQRLQGTDGPETKAVVVTTFFFGVVCLGACRAAQALSGGKARSQAAVSVVIALGLRQPVLDIPAQDIV